MDETDVASPQRPARTRPTAGQRSAAKRRQQARRRRAVVLAVLLLVGGTVLARTLRDPGDVGAVAAARLASVGGDRADPSARTPDPTPGTAAATDASTADASATSPTGSATTSVATTSPHADADGGADADTSRLPVPASGDGRVVPVDIPARPVATTGRLVRYSVEAEGGLPVSTVEFARTVATVLTDPRGWQTKDGVRFVPVSPAQLAAGAGVDVRVTLASPRLTAKLCAPLNVTIQQVSCWNGSRSVLNLTRWMHGSVTYPDRLADYRVYLVSHEVGHGLGHNHVSCPAAGAPAPVMVQQTKSLEGCRAAPWPTDG